MSTDVRQSLLDRSRSVAETGDSLSVALAKQDQSEIEAAMEDLLEAYDHYAARAVSFSSRFGFDEVTIQATSEARDQSSASALASALVDLEVANLLVKAAQASGELEGTVDTAAIDVSVNQLNTTLVAIQGRPEIAPGLSRFAFDEVMAAQPAGFQASPDLAAAKAAYLQQVTEVYDRLMAESASLLAESFKGVDKLDVSQIKTGLKYVGDVVNATAVGKVVSRALDAFQRAVKTLQGLVGPEGMKEIEDRVTRNVEKIKEGEKAVQQFLKYSYHYDENRNLISGWVESTVCGIPEIDGGRQKLLELNQNVVQTFTLCSKIVSSLGSLGTPVKWILTKVGGAAPLDLVFACLFFLVADIALLRGMDYADTTQIVKFVDGTVIISRQALGAS